MLRRGPFPRLKLFHQYGQHELIPVLELAKAGYQATDKVDVFLGFGFHAPSVVGLHLGVCGRSYLPLQAQGYPGGRLGATE